MAYLDTSVLAAYYCPEELSTAVAKALESVAEPVISPLVEVELYSALATKVRTGSLSAVDAQGIIHQFVAHLDDGYYRVIDIGIREYHVARDWLAQFASPLRSLDALHLAAAYAQDLELFTADKALCKSAGVFSVRCTLIEL